MDFGKKTGLSGAEIWWNHWISKHSGLVLWTHPLVYCRCPWSWTSYHRRGFSTLFYARCWCRGALFVGRGCTTTKCSSTWELPLGCFTAGMWSKFSVPSRKSSHILTLSYPSGIGGSHAWAGLGQSKENWQGSSVRVRCFSLGKSPAIMFFFKCVYHFFGDAKFTKQWVFQKIFIGVKHILINDLWFLFGILGSNPFISWLCKVTIIRRCGSQMSCQCMLVGIQYPSSIFQFSNWSIIHRGFSCVSFIKSRVRVANPTNERKCGAQPMP